MAALAIIVSSTLWVAGQIAQRYNLRMFWQVFRRPIFVYIVLCIVCIALPLIVIATPERLSESSQKILVNTFLVLTLACLSLLPLSLLYNTVWLRPEEFLADLVRGAQKKLRQTRGKQLPDEANILRYLVAGSSPMADYKIVIGGIRALRDIAIFSISILSKKTEKDGEVEEAETLVSEQIMDILCDIERSFMADSTTPTQVVNEIPYAFGKIGGKLTEENLTRAKKALRLLGEMGSISLEKKRDKVALQIVGAINYVGVKAMKSNLASLRKEAINRLRLAFLANAKDMPNVAKRAAYHLVGLGEKAIERKFDSELQNILSALGSVAIRSIELDWVDAIPRAIDSLKVLGENAGSSELQISTKAAIYFLSQVASKVVEIDNKDWTVHTIVSLERITSKALEKPALNSLVKEGARFLREITRICASDHPTVAFIAGQLWILAAESRSEEVTTNILGELADLEDERGKEPVDKGFRKACWWAKDGPSEYKRALKKIYGEYRTQRRANEFSDEWDGFRFLEDEY